MNPAPIGLNEKGYSAGYEAACTTRFYVHS